MESEMRSVKTSRFPSNQEAPMFHGVGGQMDRQTNTSSECSVSTGQIPPFHSCIFHAAILHNNKSLLQNGNRNRGQNVGIIIWKEENSP
jgi:hypothetical protein